MRKILPSSMLEQLENQEGDYAIVQELLQDFELIVDSFEQAVERQGR